MDTEEAWKEIKLQNKVLSVEELQQKFPLLGKRRLMDEIEDHKRQIAIREKSKQSVMSGMILIMSLWFLLLSIIMIHIFRSITEGVEYMGKGPLDILFISWDWIKAKIN